MITTYNKTKYYISSLETDKRWKEILFLNLVQVWNESNRVKVMTKQVNLSEEDKKELLDIHII